MLPEVQETYFTMDDGVKIYTRIIKPANKEKCPIVFIRTPYDPARNGKPCFPEEFKDNQFIKKGYAVVCQHTRGSGDSEGMFCPYGERERKDALISLEEIRKLPFYNEEIYLCGMSYLTQVHYLYLNSKPSDIKGAVFAIQTTNMYKRNYRNGCCYNFSNLPWWAMVLKRNYPNITEKGVIKRPYKDIPLRMAGENIPVLYEMLTHDEYDEFWESIPMVNALKNLDIPVLFVEGWYDYYSHSMFSDWEELTSKQRDMCSMLVMPIGHACWLDGKAQYPVDNGNAPGDYAVQWFESIRNNTPYLYSQMGKITYYNIGTDSWKTAEYPKERAYKRIYIKADKTLGDTPVSGQIAYKYDPEKRHNFFKYDNIFKHPKADEKQGIISFYSEEFKEDTEFFGRIKWNMSVKSDCEDTMFFMRLYLVENGESYNLTEALTTISYINKDYVPGTDLHLILETAPMNFTVKKGCGLRVDISSDGTIFAPHANVKGKWCDVTETRVATNTLICNNDSYLELPVK